MSESLNHSFKPIKNSNKLTHCNN